LRAEEEPGKGGVLEACVVERGNEGVEGLEGQFYDVGVGGEEAATDG